MLLLLLLLLLLLRTRLLSKTFTESLKHFDHQAIFFKRNTLISTRFKIM